MSDLSVNILDGQLGAVPQTIANAVVHAGVCPVGTPNTVYGLGETNAAIATLGLSQLAEAVGDTVKGAGPCFACPINPSVLGSVSATTHTGPGAGTVTASLAPHVQVKAKIVLGGALGTMTVQFSLNGGASYGAVFTSTGGSFAMVVPGTFCKLSFAAQTYTAADVWTFNTDGTSSLVGAGTLGWVTQQSSPLDNYAVYVVITTTGALGVAQFKVSVDGAPPDGGNTLSTDLLVPGGGVYVVPGTGVVLTFASTFVDDDTYTIRAVTAGFSGGDATAALTAIGNSTFSFVAAHIVGNGANAAAAASLAATVDVSMTAFELAFRYMFAIVECPTNGSPGGSAESEATVIAAFSGFASNRVMVCAGDIAHISQLGSAQVLRRNCGFPTATRIALTPPSEDPGRVARGKLPGVKAIYRDEEKTPGFAIARFTTVTTRPQKTGNYYIKNGLMMASPGSDFATVMNRRVMDVACGTTVRVLVDLLNEDLLVNKTTGYIYDPEACKIEQRLDAELATALVNTSPKPDATAVRSTVSRTTNIISTANLPVTVSVTPKGYARTISVTIGFSNPALGT